MTREERLRKYKEEQEKRLKEGEEGARPTSFAEIPGAMEGKSAIKAGIQKMNFPGSKLAAEAADVMLPENLTEIAAPVMRGVKKLGAVAPAINKYVKAGKAFEKKEDAGKLAKASAEIKKAEELNPPSYSKIEAAAPANTPDRLPPNREVGKYSPEQLKKFKEDREELKRIKNNRLSAAARK